MELCSCSRIGKLSGLPIPVSWDAGCETSELDERQEVLDLWDEESSRKITQLKYRVL
jgi:hypothetical protein